MLLEVLGILGIQGIGKAINTQVGKGRMNEYGVYRDGNGNYRLASNGRKVYDSFDKNGDMVYKYVSDGLTAINVSLIEAAQNEEKAKQNGERFYLRQNTTSYTPLGNKNIMGARYCETGRSRWLCYVERSFTYRDENGGEYHGSFYMNMNYKLYAPTERTVKFDKQLYKELRDEGLLTDRILISEDNTELYNKIIDTWNSSNMSSDIADNLRVLGKSKKSDYKDVYDRISRKR